MLNLRQCAARVFDRLHPHDALESRVVQPLMMCTAHAGDHSPLGSAGQEDIEGRQMLFPDLIDAWLSGLLVSDAQRGGIALTRVFYPAGTRPPPTGIFQFFAAASLRPCWAANQLMIKFLRT